MVLMHVFAKVASESGSATLGLPALRHICSGPDSVIQGVGCGAGQVTCRFTYRLRPDRVFAHSHRWRSRSRDWAGLCLGLCLIGSGGRGVVAGGPLTMPANLTHSPPSHLQPPKKLGAHLTPKNQSSERVGISLQGHSWHGRKKEKGEFQPRLGNVGGFPLTHTGTDANV